VHLKRLQLIGFKTFAERTVIEFAPGVTAIVGPNGSGKSNIADAILWVLGEQRASAIRGTKLQDVIFSGSALRKPIGLAEVSLTVDNSDGSIPLSFDEITVTRRAYRNGEGEFFINKTACRLKDIQDLFLDTGVGRESYALVNQSEIDAVLSADPQARRILFEEAAGIHKFRVKKREALRKLELTESNLVRIRDIVREIERQLGPLEIQAEVAVRYNATRERLESLEKSYLVAELRQVNASLDETRADHARASRLAVERTASLREAENRASALAQSLAEADHLLDGVRARHQAALTHLERARADRELALQRGQGAAAQIEMVRAEIDDLRDRLDAASSTLKTVGTQSGEAAESIAENKARIEILDSQRRELLPRIAELRRSEETRMLRIAERERAKIAGEAEIASLQARAAQAREREDELARRVADVARELAGFRAESAARESERAAAATAADQAERNRAAAESDVQAARDSLASLQADVARLQSDAASARTRLQTLQELEAAHEGYFSGVRAVMQASRRSRLAGDYVVVADAFTAPVGLDIAFDVALASSLQDIIVRTEDEAKDAIDLLKRDRAGRATFLPLNRIRPPERRPDIPRGMSGLLGIAADLARYDACYNQVMELLLGRVVICETIDDALAVAERAQGWHRIVTLAGEVLLPSGAISGGFGAKSQAGSLVHRKTEIAELIGQTEANASRIADAEQVAGAAQSELQASVEARGQAASACDEHRKALNAAERVADQIAREVDRLDREHATLSARLVQLKSDRQSAEKMLDERIDAVRAIAGQAEMEPDGSAPGQPDTSLLPILVESEQRLQEELVQLRVLLASAQEKARSERQMMESARSEIERIQAQLERRQARLKALADESDGLTDLSAEMADLEAEAAAAVKAVSAELDSGQNRRHRIATEARDAQSAVRLVSEERGEARNAVQSAELREAKLQMQFTQTATRLLDEYDITVADALALPETPPVAPDTPREVARLRRELRAFGDVNAQAAAEYAELRARYDTMYEQLQDAEVAKVKVLAAIREIDDSTRGLFMASFARVAEEFEAIFQRLMGGGRTELTLTDPDNLLETGVDISVQAPGKKKQNLMLLSGGERALTAAALLFAFLKVRPAPFCVLDEVDAPLDGVNVERFTSLLREFGLRDQFLIITHNPSTMEAARCWYGVTMQEPGVSRVLSMEAPRSLEPARAVMEPMEPAEMVGASV
jgi:chromosome segregation protein